jgi:hypothetical protein
MKNVRVSSARIERRWDSSVYRTFDDGDVIQSVPMYRKEDGTYAALALTGTDLCQVRAGTSETYSYLTDTYITGTISNITGAVVTGTSTAWSSSGLAAGDKFILEDDLTPKGEPDATWATILTIDSDTQITLTASYTGTTGALTTEKYRARKVYTCPIGERWSYATVAGKFCFSNGNTLVQYWGGDDPEITSPATDNFVTDLNATYAKQSKYMIGYAGRLWLANTYNESTAIQDQWLLRGSAYGDPTDFTTEGHKDYSFYESEEPITGIGIVGSYLIVYKRTQYHLAHQSGVDTDPLQFSSHKKGVGLYAPYSLVHADGTNLWLGADDFYRMEADTAVSIGGSVRKVFFDLIEEDDLKRVVGVNNNLFSEVLWIATTATGQYVFSYNYKHNEWGPYTFTDNLTGIGGFGL